MKLRDRLYLFSTAQLLVFGLVFVIAYMSFEGSVLPIFRRLLHDKTEQAVRMLRAELDVPLGADDHALLERAVSAVVNDEDLAYLTVLDAHDHPVLVHGEIPRDARDGNEGDTFTTERGIRAWATVSLEGMPLGTVAVGFTTARFDALATAARRLAVLVMAMWLIAVAYSLRFARQFVSPIRAMMNFSRKVAGGALAERLSIDAPGELRELRDYLNEMTAELEGHEAARKLAAEHAEAMQRELLTVSRMAGMAEIATGVLHNVGNVLNSLNISVAMINDQVRGSRVSGLTRAIELADNFPGGLVAFLATDKGKLLPGYLSTVSKRLADENTKVIEELAAILGHVDHIKAIVAMQQAYARPSGLQEIVSIGSLIDDALRMGEASFAKHGIDVVRDYETGLQFVTDRHKLLQILINLISNARHALKDHRAPRAAPAQPAEPGDAAPPYRLTVRVRSTPLVVTIAVSDTGIGIPAANLGKIFQHGFTTKRGGHGFGLHASANTARELGGRLEVTSDGPGLGATFTLELPAALPIVLTERAHDLRN